MKRVFWIIAIGFFTYLMMDIVIPYFSWERDVGFLMTKLEIIHLDYYMYSFYTHIATSLVVLFLGAFLFIEFKHKAWWAFHRQAGKIYVFGILLLAAPSGIIMGFHANGGIGGQINFVLLSFLWWIFTFIGFKKVLNGDVRSHKQWMIRSYALTLSAITLRMLQMLFPIRWQVDPVTQYLIVSWTSWTFNLLIAEIIIRWQIQK